MVNKSKPKRLKVLTPTEFRAYLKKRAASFRREQRNTAIEAICADQRFTVRLNFKIPKGVFPMAFDPCFREATGKASSGSGTMFTNGPPVRAVNRDLDFDFSKKRDALRAAKALLTVLDSHRLRGKVVVEDTAWEPPLEIEVPRSVDGDRRGA